MICKRYVFSWYYDSVYEIFNKKLRYFIKKLKPDISLLSNEFSIEETNECNVPLKITLRVSANNANRGCYQFNTKKEIIIYTNKKQMELIEERRSDPDARNKVCNDITLTYNMSSRKAYMYHNITRFTEKGSTRTRLCNAEVSNKLPFDTIHILISKMNSFRELERFLYVKE